MKEQKTKKRKNNRRNKTKQIKHRKIRISQGNQVDKETKDATIKKKMYT